MKHVFFFGAWLAVALLGCSSGGAAGDGGAGAGSGGSGGAASAASTASATSGTTTTAAAATTGPGGGTSTGSGGGGGGSGSPTVSMSINPSTARAGASVMATVAVTHFVLEAPVGQADEPGHGHYHIYLDDAAGGDYLVADQTPKVTVVIPQGTSVGAHTLRISLGENDHSPLVPAVEDTVDLTVVAP